MKTRSEVMVGNYAIARGFVEAGIELAAAYPGTPSSEILPGIIEFKKREKATIHTEWSTNERCALEVAFGAALNGKKTVCLMKQVGLNVAFPGLLKGRKKTVKGAFVIVSCDDPGPQSSQTEQDTRLLAVLYGIPVFDPASPTEAADIAYHAVQYSAEHKVPVIVRSTHRVSHARESIPLYPIGKRKVTLQEGIQSPFNVPCSTFNVKTEQTKGAGTECVIASPQGSAIPQSRSPRRFAPRDDSKMSNIEPPIESFEGSHRTLNAELNPQFAGQLGIVASGMSYSIAMDVIAELGLADTIPVYKVVQLSADSRQPSAVDSPLSALSSQLNTPSALRNFVDHIDKILVLEETDIVIEALISDPKKIFGRRNGYVPVAGELTYDVIRDIIAKIVNETKIAKIQIASDRAIEETLKGVHVQPRPPRLCAGCPHRASFYAMRYAFPEAVFPGDIGCYTLGIAQGAVDTCLDMGAGVNIASGFHDTYVQDGALIPIIASTGDSTFFHACLAALYDAVKKQKRFILVIMDNGTTAMTGMQPTPQTGVTADGTYTHAMKIEDVVKGLGVGFLRILDPYDIPLMISTIKEAYGYLSDQPTADSRQQTGDRGQRSEVGGQQTVSEPSVLRSQLSAPSSPLDASRLTPPDESDPPLSALRSPLPTPAVIIARRECILFAKEKRKDMLDRVPIERDCIGCKSCLTLFDCPAMYFDDAANKVKIDEGLCVRCGMCLFACTMGKQGKGLFRFQDTYFIKNRL